MCGVRREETLEERSGGVKDRGALAADLDANGDLRKVDEVGVDSPDVRGRVGVQVELS